MGCLPSKFRFGSLRITSNNENAEKEDEDTNKIYSWDKKKNVDPSDYTIENLIGSEAGRLPGVINGEQFIIQNCQNTQIYLFDYINTITIDDCSDCCFYIGPVTGSLFIRNCKDCTLVVACGQFRTRDCQKIDVFVHCQTKPIIESSTKMRFGCYQSNYPQLNDHFLKSGLSVYNNNWSEIHDFTPDDGGRNWVTLKEVDAVHENFPLPKEGEFSKVGLTFKSDESLVPLTGGSPNYGSSEACLTICFYNDKYHENATDFISKLRKANFTVLYTREMKMVKGLVNKLFGGSTLAALAKKGPVVAVLCTGAGVVEASKKTVNMLNGGSKMPVAYATDPTDEGPWQKLELLKRINKVLANRQQEPQ